MKLCFLFARADCSDHVLPKPEKRIKIAISKGIQNFYVGNRGAFGRLVAAAVKRVKRKQLEVCLYLLLANHPAKREVLLKWVKLLILVIMAIGLTTQIQMLSGCFLCDCPPCSALRLVDLQAGEVLDLELSPDSETFSLLRCGEAAGYRQGSKWKISLEDGEINGTRQKLCQSCQKLIPKDFSGRYILFLIDGSAVKEILCLDENVDYSFLNYWIFVTITENYKQLLITAMHCQHEQYVIE